MRTWDQDETEKKASKWALAIMLAVAVGFLLGTLLSSDAAVAGGHNRYDDEGRRLVPIRATDIRLPSGKHTQPIARKQDTVWIAEGGWW